MIYIFVIIPLIICIYIFIFSMCYAAKTADEAAEQLFNEMMRRKNNENIMQG